MYDYYRENIVKDNHTKTVWNFSHSAWKGKSLEETFNKLREIVPSL